MIPYSSSRRSRNFTSRLKRCPLFEEAAMLLPGNVNNCVQTMLEEVVQRLDRGRRVESYDVGAQALEELEISQPTGAFGQSLALRVHRKRPVRKSLHIEAIP